jgi:hypothetical protein
MNRDYVFPEETLENDFKFGKKVDGCNKIIF